MQCIRLQYWPASHALAAEAGQFAGTHSTVRNFALPLTPDVIRITTAVRLREAILLRILGIASLESEKKGSAW